LVWELEAATVGETAAEVVGWEATEASEALAATEGVGL
jgi:hypothetical protein